MSHTAFFKNNVNPEIFVTILFPIDLIGKIYNKVYWENARPNLAALNWIFACLMDR